MENKINDMDILGYKPNLNIESRPNSYYEEEDYGVYQIDEDEYTTVVTQFDIHRPSSKINSMTELHNNITIYKENIEKELANNEYFNKYINADSSTKETILKENSLDMKNGTTRLEVYDSLSNIDNEIVEVAELFSKAIYGKDIDVSDEIDEANIEKIKFYEINGEYEKINYLSLYYDTQISFLIGEYTSRLSEISMELNYIKDIPYKNKADENSEVVIQKSFDKRNHQLDKDIAKEQYSKEDILIALKNIFIAKQELNMYLDSFSDLFALGDEVDVVQEIKQEGLGDLDDKIDNLIKTTMLSSLNKQDIQGDLVKKSKIRGFFK